MDRGIVDLTIHGDLTCSANKKNSKGKTAQGVGPME